MNHRNSRNYRQFFFFFFFFFFLIVKKKLLNVKVHCFMKKKTKTARCRKYSSDINTCINFFHKRISVGSVNILLQAMRKEKDIKVKPAKRFKLYQYLFTKKRKDSNKRI